MTGVQTCALPILGSSVAFLVYRYVFTKQFKKVMGTNKAGREGGKWEAFQVSIHHGQLSRNVTLTLSDRCISILQAVVKSKSLLLLIALRWCPLPFAVSPREGRPVPPVSFC